LKYSEIPRRQELLKSKWPHINAEIVLRKKLNVKNDTGQRNFHTILNENGETRLIKYINNVDKARNS
jgi:hypothetical protein